MGHSSRKRDNYLLGGNSYEIDDHLITLDELVVRYGTNLKKV